MSNTELQTAIDACNKALCESRLGDQQEKILLTHLRSLLKEQKQRIPPQPGDATLP